MRMGPTLEPSGGGDDQLSVRTERPDPGTTVLHVRGEVDMLTSSRLQTSIEQSLDAEPQVLVVDLEDVGFLGTSGLAALIQIRGAARLAGAELRLACTNRQVLRPLALAGLTGLFSIYESVPAALDAQLAE
ncbi:MAG: STAS domain-containing protein [Pseudonocardiales bacterium]|nr:STAS domain-containing protein [Pseudonocardiales bacterium]